MTELTSKTVSIVSSTKIKTISELDIIPNEFICPITHEIMRNPLISKHGQTYECDAIITWLYNHNSLCPLTRQVLKIKDLIRHRSLQYRIEMWQRSNCIRTDESSTDDIDDDYNTQRIMLYCIASELFSASNHSHGSTISKNKSFPTATSRSSSPLQQHLNDSVAVASENELRTTRRRPATGQRILRFIRMSP